MLQRGKEKLQKHVSYKPTKQMYKSDFTTVFQDIEILFNVY